MNREFLIGIEVRPNVVVAGLVDLNGKVAKKIVLDIDQKKGNFVETIITAINKVKKEDILGIGIAIDATIDRKKGLIVDSQIQKLKNLNLRQEIFDETKIPTYVERTANCYAITEYRITNARRVKSLCVLNIADEITIGTINGGKLYRGNFDAEGNLGHTIINSSQGAAKCECGKKGCLKAYSSEKCIKENYKKASKKQKSIEEIIALAKKDKRAAKIIDEAIKNLAYGIFNAVKMFDPELLILYGQIPNDLELLDKIRKEFDNVAEKDARKLKIICGKTEDSSILGAASIIMSQESV